MLVKVKQKGEVRNVNALWKKLSLLSDLETLQNVSVP